MIRMTHPTMSPVMRCIPLCLMPHGSLRVLAVVLQSRRAEVPALRQPARDGAGRGGGAAGRHRARPAPHPAQGQHRVRSMTGSHVWDSARCAEAQPGRLFLSRTLRFRPMPAIVVGIHKAAAVWHGLQGPQLLIL